MAPLGISRHGLTRCPGCKGHVKLAEAGDPPVCPFCATPLSGDTAMSGLLRLASSSRSALIAGALFASPGLVACGDDSSDSSDTGGAVTDTADDTAADTAADGGDITVPDDMVRALYGMPADVPMDMGPEPDATNDTQVPDDVTRALYGMPADVPMDMGPDPDAATDSSSPPDCMRAAYGMPPQEDVGPEPDAESDASDASGTEDVGPMPLYGAPPPPMDAGSSDASDASDA